MTTAELGATHSACSPEYVTTAPAAHPHTMAVIMNSDRIRTPALGLYRSIGMRHALNYRSVILA